MAPGKRKQKQKSLRLLIILIIIAGAALVFFLIAKALIARADKNTLLMRRDIAEENWPEIDVELLSVNEYSRPGVELKEVNDIVIHYTANPGTDADANRNYFESLATTGETYASSHFIVGLGGNIIQCVPTNEIAYASNSRNDDTISIENCYYNEDGSFEEATYSSLVHLTAWLCARNCLTGDDVIRHYDIGGKPCPLYYVNNEDKWLEFKEDVQSYIEENYKVSFFDALFYKESEAESISEN